MAGSIWLADGTWLVVKIPIVATSRRPANPLGVVGTVGKNFRWCAQSAGRFSTRFGIFKVKGNSRGIFQNSPRLARQTAIPHCLAGRWTVFHTNLIFSALCAWAEDVNCNTETILLFPSAAAPRAPRAGRAWAACRILSFNLNPFNLDLVGHAAHQNDPWDQEHPLQKFSPKLETLFLMIIRTLKFMK